MKRMLDATVDAYLERSVATALGRSARDRALRRMEAVGRREGLPLIDRQVGRLLEILVTITGARRILEIGTAIGYSTAWLASAAGPKGRVTSFEIDPERAARARQNLRAAGLERRVEVVVGDARALVRSLRGPLDLIFNDGAKSQYPAIAAAAKRLLRAGGLLVSDNALWSGAVARRGGDADTRAIRRHNASLMRGSAFTSIIVPIRDGVLVARRSEAQRKPRS